MKRIRDNDTCTLCALNVPLAYCSCLTPPALLCDVCLGSHFSSRKKVSHEIRAILGELPPCKPRRSARNSEAVRKLKDNLRLIDAWERDMCETADFMAAQVESFRTTVGKELQALRKEVETDIETAIREHKEKFFEHNPQFSSPIAKALRNLDTGSLTLLSCQTNFTEVRRAFAEFLFTVDLCLQTEVSDYSPKNIIKVRTDINPWRKVNIYERPKTDFTTITTQTKPLGELSPATDSSFCLRRGPVKVEKGVYCGQWNQNNQFHGYGTLQSKKGHVYIGQFRDGKRHGTGRFLRAEGRMFDGNFRGDVVEGFGKLVKETGTTYRGEYVGNMPGGVGCYTAKTETGEVAYFGEFVRGAFEGRGVEFGKETLYAGELAEKLLILSHFEGQ